MAYVQPSNRALGELITTARWNQDVVANIQYLKTPPITTLGFTSFNTSSTSYVPVHETKNIITTTGGRVLFGASGTAFQAASTALTIFLTLYVDGVKIVTANDEGLTRAHVSSTSYAHVPWAIVFPSGTLTAGMHTFRLYAKVSAATGYVYLQRLFLLEV